MTYPFVPAPDHWPRNAPVRAVVIHHAEGGGTVRWLQRPDGNSSHYVVEYTGRIVQMVREDRAAGSIDPTKVRRDDDAPYTFLGETITYGATANKACLGDHWQNPNAAVIAVEVEGFARDGPNPTQRIALQALVEDIRTRYPGLPALGHRDFQNYKACPGRKVPWSDYGGHASRDTQAPEEPVLDFTWIKDQPDSGPGTVTVNGDGHAVILANGTLYYLANGSEKHSYGLLRFKDGNWAGQDAYMVGDDCGFLLKRAATYVPGPITEDAVQAELERAADRAHSAVLAR